MTRPPRGPTISIALPVFNGADSLAPVIESVLSQSHADLELLISDNASTDGTQEICRQFERDDARVVYRRQRTNVGLLANFVSAAENASGTYLRWIGDEDWLDREYVSRVLDVFRDDPGRVLVSTQIAYADSRGNQTLDTAHDPSSLASHDPVHRFADVLRLLTSGFARLDPLYAMMRREVALMPRRNMLREDQVFAARLALAGPWGHLPEALAGRRREETGPAAAARLLGVPAWRSHVRVILQCRELSHWVAQSSLDAAQRRRARAEIARFYGRSKSATARQQLARATRLARRPGRLAPSTAP